MPLLPEGKDLLAQHFHAALRALAIPGQETAHYVQGLPLADPP
jgi:hypothetical protein